MGVSWRTADQHILPYTGSADGVAMWVDVNFGRNRGRAEKTYNAVVKAASGISYYCSKLYF